MQEVQLMSIQQLVNIHRYAVRSTHKAEDLKELVVYEQWLCCDCCDQWQKVSSDSTRSSSAHTKGLWRCDSCTQVLCQWQQAPLEMLTTERVLHQHRKPRIGRLSVVVIGAGVSGLAAARELQDTAQAQVVVLEARGRVGGRVCTNTSWGAHGDAVVDMGASFIHGCFLENPVYRLAQMCGATVDCAAGGYSNGWGPRGRWYDPRTSAAVRAAVLRPALDLFNQVWARMLQMARDLRAENKVLHWVQCDLCSKWRAGGSRPGSECGEAVWNCADGGLSCDAPELSEDEIAVARDISLEQAFVQAQEELCPGLGDTEAAVLDSMKVVAWAFVGDMQHLSLASLHPDQAELELSLIHISEPTRPY
eukprot:TRINITY_DN7180_c0_g1_i1.p1 TRINITY_DN7180_c0_g1~~TRINITY_DN7180_c0_g1_i1.p1  ORF type:complete len:363 (+),score=105.57 TRINITY_DN7180_c0_g1_i1:612-1700(+)